MNSEYEPHEEDLISGATTKANRDEIINILGKEDIESRKAYLEHLKKKFAENADPIIGNQIATLEDNIVTEEEYLNSYNENSKITREQEKFPFKSEQEHIN